MFGTVAHYRIKPASEAALLALSREMAANPPPGFVAAHIYRLDAGSDTYVTASVWSDRATYRKNADDPRQQQWFARFRDLLAEDPTWFDGEVVADVDQRVGTHAAS